MKKIIICEGKNDGIFMEGLLGGLGVQKEKYKIFCQNDVNMQEKKYAETDVLRHFTEKHIYNPREILVKLEGGNDSATKIFCRELIRCLNGAADLVLLLDCDTLSVEQKTKKIQEYVDGAYGRTTPIQLTFKNEQVSNHLEHLSCNVKFNRPDELIGEFRLALFKSSLERSCNIQDQDSPQTKKTKIDQFIKEEKVCKFFQPLLL
jgi:hypothetical protein